MLHRRDPVTGKQLTDSMIIDNMITFLFAGHDTTASMFSLLMYHLIQSPGAYTKVQKEIDRVLKGGAITVEYLNELPYLKAYMLKTLRLEPTAQVFSLTPLVDDGVPVILGGRYEVRRGQTTFVFLPGLHRDPAVFGKDADEFRPERISEKNVKKLPSTFSSCSGTGHGAASGMTLRSRRPQ
ncbi:cytochrome P450 [Hypoxylon rubiginosum]|uniref:Cytochrome P450 n=1 Tax=Hypoxylon rubiginosum TaxID=110542 RepID=A0ACC0CNP4_9PEZI|nr:cytochrome P450 [Hypoxylon rubiginosum]